MTRDNAKDCLKSYLPDYVERITTKSKGANKYVCPLCGSGNGKHGTGAFSIKDGIIWKCFSCVAGGDIFDLYGAINGTGDYNQQFSGLCEMYGLVVDERTGADKREFDERGHINTFPAAGIPQNATQKPQEPQAQEQTDYRAFFSEAHKRIGETEYPKLRGLSQRIIDRFNLGYVPKWRHPKAPPNVPASPRLIIPISPTSYLARDVREIIPESQKDYSKLKVGNIQIFNKIALQEAQKPIFVVEGEIDAMSIIDAGGEAVALGTVSQVKAFIKLCEDEPPVQPLIISLDNDQAGKSATETLRQGLAQLGIGCAIANICGECKDPNEALIANREKFVVAVERAERLAWSNAQLVNFAKTNLKCWAHSLKKNGYTEKLNNVENLSVVLLNLLQDENDRTEYPISDDELQNIFNSIPAFEEYHACIEALTDAKCKYDEASGNDSGIQIKKDGKGLESHEKKESGRKERKRAIPFGYDELRKMMNHCPIPLYPDALGKVYGKSISTGEMRPMAYAEQKEQVVNWFDSTKADIAKAEAEKAHDDAISHGATEKEANEAADTILDHWHRLKWNKRELPFDDVFSIHKQEYFIKNNPYDLLLEDVERIKHTVEWDGVKRAERFLIDFLKAPDNEYSRTNALYFLVSLICRLCNPGCKVDSMLILAGAQGIGKSSLFRRLIGAEYCGTVDFQTLADDKKLMEKLKNGNDPALKLIEVEELGNLNKVERNIVKASTSKTKLSARMAYDRDTQTYLMSCIFYGTTNEISEYLPETKGGRRFIPQTCYGRGIDFNIITNEWRDQLLREVVTYYDAGMFIVRDGKYVSCIYPTDNPAYKEAIENATVRPNIESQMDKLLWPMPDDYRQYNANFWRVFYSQTENPLYLTKGNSGFLQYANGETFTYKKIIENKGTTIASYKTHWTTAEIMTYLDVKKQQEIRDAMFHIFDLQGTVKARYDGVQARYWVIPNKFIDEAIEKTSLYFWGLDRDRPEEIREIANTCPIDFEMLEYSQRTEQR